MRVNYVTLADEKMPAVRYRMKIPGEYIGDYSITQFPDEADIHVFGKPYHHSLPLLEKTVLMAKRFKYVFDICDDMFSRNNGHAEYTRTMALNAAKVTVPTERMAEIVIMETGRYPVVISDPVEFDEKPIKDISDPKVLWFGTMTNLNMLNGREVPYPLEVVCSDDKKATKIADYNDVKYTIWSIESMKEAFDRNNIVFIPSSAERNKSVKSPNRVCESIRNGMAVVADIIPSYEPFSGWISTFDDLKPMTRDAQEYVNRHHSKEVIGEQWKTLFASI